MKHFFTTTVKVVLVAALLISVALAVVGNLLGKTPADVLVQTVLTPLRTGASSLTTQAEKFYNYIFRYEALEAENAALRQQLAEMEEAAREAASVSRENDRLRDLLNLNPAQEGFSLVDGYIIAWDSADWASSFTIWASVVYGLYLRQRKWK